MKTYYYTSQTTHYEPYLSHHGVKGMKWGVRHDKAYMSRRKVKKALRNNSENQDRVIGEYRNAIKSNKKWNELGKRSTSIANSIMKSEEADYMNAKGRPYDPSKKTMELYEKHSAIDKQMRKIEVDVGKKYIEKMNDARLKDIKYSGSTENGRKMLEKYRLNYTIRSDGYIKGAHVQSDYIRPQHL